MVIVSVDNDRARLERFDALLRRTFPDCTLVEFTDPMLAVKHIVNEDVDVVFAEVSMRPADGTTISRVLRRNRPDARVILMQDVPQAAYNTVRRPETGSELIKCVMG